MRSIGLVLAAALLPAGAQAFEGSLGDDFLANVQSQPKTPTNPRSGSFSDQLATTLQLSDQWAVDLALSGTFARPTQPIYGETFGSRGGNVWVVAPAVDWDPGDHFHASLALAISPKSTLSADSILSVAGVDYDVDLVSKTASQGATLELGFDTASDSSFDTSLDLAVTGLHLATDQEVEKAWGPGGAAVDRATVAGYCQNNQNNLCGPELNAVLGNTKGGSDLGQFSFSASALQTLWRHTDLGLAFTWYEYTSDPTRFGFYSLNSAGLSFGSGVPLAPVRWSLRPEVAQRFGNLSVRLVYLHQQYMDDQGQGNSLALKVQYRFTKEWKASLTAAIERDRDSQGNDLDSLTVGASLRWKFL